MGIIAKAAWVNVGLVGLGLMLPRLQPVEPILFIAPMVLAAMVALATLAYEYACVVREVRLFRWSATIPFLLFALGMITSVILVFR
jgi:hypothetical protein